MNNRDTWARVYWDAQKACGLKVGDYVKVIDKVEENSPVWPAWCSATMDKTVGRIGQIKSISSESIYVWFDDCCFTYPYFVLEKIDRPCSFSIDDYVRVIGVGSMDTNISGMPSDKLWWNPEMSKTLGKVGQVMNVSDTHVRVKFAPGIDWNYYADCLEKVEKPAHVFKPFDKVLVRDFDDNEWEPQFYSWHMKNDAETYRTTSGSGWKQCIPYEGNEHLCGTTDMPEE